VLIRNKVHGTMVFVRGLGGYEPHSKSWRPKNGLLQAVVHRTAEQMPVSRALRFDLVQWGAGQHFDHGHQFDAKDIKVGMPTSSRPVSCKLRPV